MTDRELIDRVRRRWEIRRGTKELGLKPQPWHRRWAGYVYKPRFDLRSFYLWTAEEFAQPSLMSETTPLKHDNIKKPLTEIWIFALDGGWSIERKALLLLKSGPLYSEDGTLLVPSGGSVRLVLNRWQERNRGLLTIITIISGIIATAIRLLW